MSKHHEDYEQKLIFEWAGYYPVLKWMFAVPNGGKRNPREAARLKAQGVKAGVFDIFLPLPLNGYHGLYIEVKRRKQDGPSRVSDKQNTFKLAMEVAGYRCEICYGANEAIDIIKKYVKI